MKLLLRLNSVFLLLFLLVVTSFAEGNGFTFEREMGGIEEYTLDSNGLKLLIVSDPSAEEAGVNIVFGVGSRYEGYGETGATHLLEHLLFKSSKNHPDITQELKNHALNYNGTTWTDRTNYYETFEPTIDKLCWALSLESDRLTNCVVKKEYLDSEMSVVRNEFEMGEDSHVNNLWEAVESAAYRWHNYGNSTIGARSDIEQVRIENLADFYHHYYRPSNTTLIVVGPYPKELILRKVSHYFGGATNPQKPIIHPYTQEPAQEGQRFVRVERVGGKAFGMAAYHVPGYIHADTPALLAFKSLMTMENRGQMVKEFVNTGKIVDVGAYSYKFRDPSLMFFMGDFSDIEALESCKDDWLNLIENSDRWDFKEEDLKLLQDGVRASLKSASSDVTKMMSDLTSFVASGDWRSYYYISEQILDLDVKTVRETASRYFMPSNRTLGFYYPQEEVPQRVDIKPLASQDFSKMLDGYKPVTEVTKGEVFDFTPKNIVNRQVAGQLDSGWDYLFFPRKTRGNWIHGALTYQIPVAGLTHKQTTALYVATSLLNKGTQSIPLAQWDARLAEMGSAVNFNLDRNSLNVVFECTDDNLAETLAMIMSALKEPAFSGDELEKTQRQLISVVEQSKTNPAARAKHRFDQLLFPYPEGSFYQTVDLDRAIGFIGDLSVDEVVHNYAQHAMVRPGLITLGGGLETKNTEQLLDKVLTSATVKSESVDFLAYDYFKPNPQAETISIADKKNALLYMGHTLKLDRYSPERAALKVANWIFGGSTLSSRLGTKIRVEEGLSYGIRSAISLDELGNSKFFIKGQSNPDNFKKMEELVLVVLQDALRGGFTEQEVADAKKAYLSLIRSSYSGSSVVPVLHRLGLEGDDFNWYSQYEEAIEALTVDDVNKAFRAYIKPDQLTTVRSGSL